MKALKEHSTYRIGLAGGVCLLLMALVVAYLSTAAIGKSHYSAYLEHTAGLRAGESVQVAGVTVGKVTSTSLNGHDVKIGFTVDSGIHLGAATRAEVKVLTLLGTHYLNIVPQGSGDLKDSAIPLAHTSVPYNLQDVIEAAGNTLNEFDNKKISQSLTVVADALRGTPEAARAALSGVSALSKVAADRADQMRVMLKSARTVTGKLAENSDDIITLMKQSNLILAELVTRRDAIHKLLIDSQSLATAISGIIDDNDKEFDGLMKDLTTTLKTLKEHDKGLAESISGLAVTSRYFANATGNGPWMDLHISVPIPDNIACANPTGGCK